MKKIVKFFRTSPLTRGQIVLAIIALVLFAGGLIIGGIYQFTTNPKDFTNISFVAVGLAIICMAMVGINPKACHDWWVKSLPDDVDF